MTMKLKFKKQAYQTAAVEVAGHTPCTDDADCPAPQTCDLMLQSCS